MSLANKRLLVVEDDPDGQEVVHTILAQIHVISDRAMTVAEAEALLFNGNHYDGVIVDLALPDKDGWQLLREIQANPATASLPCVAVTAHHNSKLREEAIAAGFVAYFPKPLDATSFGRALEAVFI